MINHINAAPDAVIWAAFNASLVGAELVNDTALKVVNGALMFRLLSDMHTHDKTKEAWTYRFPQWFHDEVTELVIRGQAELRAIKPEDVR